MYAETPPDARDRFESHRRDFLVRKSLVECYLSDSKPMVPQGPEEKKKC
jgi:hypothetical protein